MGIGSVICGILYTVYATLKITFEAIIPMAFQIVKKFLGLLISVFKTINEVFKDVSNLVVTLLAEFQKILVDMFMGLLGNPFEKLCSNMWNCAALLLELLDGNGLLARALFRAAEWATGNDEGAFKCSQDRYTAAINFIRGILNDFNSFMSVVCNFGFTVSFGVDWLNDKMKSIQKMLDNWTKKQVAGINAGISYIEKIEKKIGALGIFDMLRKMASFGNCVLDSSSMCAEFSTTNNFISNVCSNFGIKKDPATGRFEFDKGFAVSLLKQLENSSDFCSELQGLTDEMVAPGGSIDAMCGGINYAKAFDLTGMFADIYHDGFSKTWEEYTSDYREAWDRILNSNKLIIDNNNYAMGLYGLDEISIGYYEIKYLMPYQYVYEDEDAPFKSIKYGVLDVSSDMSASGYPTKYGENQEIDIPYPDDSFIAGLAQKLTNDGIELYPEPTEKYNTLFNFSSYVNLCDKIEEKNDNNKKYITIKSCRGGVMLFLNCINGVVFNDNITSDNVSSYAEFNNNLGTRTMRFKNDANLNGIHNKVMIGDFIVEIGTLALAMKDFMEGIDSDLLNTLGKDNVGKALEIGKRFYGFMNIKVGEIATRYA